MMQYVKKYQVPKYDDAPSYGMIEWLHNNPSDWDGDPDGVILYGPEGKPELFAHPEDWIIETPQGEYLVVKKSDIDQWEKAK